MDVSVWIGLGLGGAAGLGFPAAVTWFVLKQLSKDLRDLAREVRTLREDLSKRILVLGPEAPASLNNGV